MTTENSRGKEPPAPVASDPNNNEPKDPAYLLFRVSRGSPMDGVLAESPAARERGAAMAKARGTARVRTRPGIENPGGLAGLQDQTKSLPAPFR